MSFKTEWYSDDLPSGIRNPEPRKPPVIPAEEAEVAVVSVVA